VPGQPVLDLRLVAQLLKNAAISIRIDAAKNIFFIVKNFCLIEGYQKKLYCKGIIQALNGEILQLLHHR
jgi:hypothetical protein